MKPSKFLCAVIGSQNTGFCHYSTDAPYHWFNKSVYVQGDVIAGSSYNRRLAYADELSPANKVLWSDPSGAYMNSSQTFYLSERVSAQRNGIVLVWQAYIPGSGVQNYWMNYTFVPKWQTAYKNGYGVSCFCGGINFEQTCVKYVYVNDDSIAGNDNNSKTGTQSSINYASNRFVLVAVLGV